jgi:hypothetical protein
MGEQVVRRWTLRVQRAAGGDDDVRPLRPCRRVEASTGSRSRGTAGLCRSPQGLRMAARTAILEPEIGPPQHRASLARSHPDGDRSDERASGPELPRLSGHPVRTRSWRDQNRDGVGRRPQAEASRLRAGSGQRKLCSDGPVARHNYADSRCGWRPTGDLVEKRASECTHTGRVNVGQRAVMCRWSVSDRGPSEEDGDG